jgi:hypothetical protein
MTYFVHSVTCNPFTGHLLPPLVTQENGSNRANMPIAKLTLVSRNSSVLFGTIAWILYISRATKPQILAVVVTTAGIILPAMFLIVMAYTGQIL